MANDFRRMKRVLIETNLVYDVHPYYVNDETDSPYYKVFRDGDTESVDFVNPKDPSENQTLLQCLSDYPPGCYTIADIIREDMRKHGLQPPEIIDEPS